VTLLVPYSWIKKASPALLQDDEIPLYGHPPAFPWEQFSAFLEKRFEQQSFKIELQSVQWRAAEELFAGLGENRIPVYFSLSPLEGSVCWVFPEDDLDLLMNLLLTQTLGSVTDLDRDFRDGFYRCLIIESMHALSQVPFDKSLSPQIVQKEELPAQDSLCLDICLIFQQKTFVGRLLVSPEFLRSWKERYATRSLSVALQTPLAQKLSVMVSLEAGRTSLKLSEWQKVRLGDFLTLDSCTLKSQAEGGRVMLTIDGAYLFRARIKNGNIKILEHPLYHEVEPNMSKKLPEHEPEPELIEEEDPLFEEDEDEGFEDEPEESEEHEDPEDQSSLDDAPDLEETDAPATEKVAKKPMTPEDIFLSVVVEVGRIQMNAQKLMDLQPGNVLDLNIRPENGVDLVVNGERIAKGELLLIGDVLGVRVLDIG